MSQCNMCNELILKKYLLSTQNAKLTEHPAFYLATFISGQEATLSNPESSKAKSPPIHN